MVPTSTCMRLRTCLTVASTNCVRSSSVRVRNSPVVPRMMIPGEPSSICQSTNRFQAAMSIFFPSSVKGVIVTP